MNTPLTYQEAKNLAMWAHGDHSYDELRKAARRVGEFMQPLPATSEEWYQLSGLMSHIVSKLSTHPDHPRVRQR